MKGIQSIKVHRGFELASTNHVIRWTEVFIIQVPNLHVQTLIFLKSWKGFDPL